MTITVARLSPVGSQFFGSNFIDIWTRLSCTIPCDLFFGDGEHVDHLKGSVTVK